VLLRAARLRPQAPAPSRRHARGGDLRTRSRSAARSAPVALPRCCRPR
jgi:hypothetical protein